ncbi:MAG: hypothetical protein A3C79_02955 [Candidatus Taylorbacteria bacterium RIFCSPHIGHO2_02_FULL_45_28]|uniref:Uncharacterized protein n=1 Tax=Candidatus Taylorbacteria bacterium RIFCSPHIGHO2_12_FULL_45_16 TaxID=1802315 RepID=A0A1G2N0X3_9BACT|nr:MAG: hypothetical protein A2830_00675 [Candidatus Taylorbacteria bacterium RIFCSPHIGHO2_01_FULL_44_110]OHA24920.1 MAG: hypothetical protein A3C79_02955 [Candidatus Taylorbacteria bacterium RIFCSPHIGHO2_02_FULL_45_28]OHA29738.1 MAG: hypothetical protein A3F51_03370 [Candidatus Taylorbacteria bacterium RIFCSPHIGHO2_12_FULL_45_16]OHA32682.1 MAG: hypothetical protein A3A23_00240 [Candidatus Taylorbacteria bacterium RIFCSPLOWO2_01_FULL_45_59]OHA38837.1 MAG: hypothetical protein A3I98_01680 [Candi
MRQFTSEEIKAQFDKLPVNVQQAVTSPEIHEKIEIVGKKYGLMIDQLGELVDEIGLVLLGLHKSSDFVDQISKRLNISGKAALTISQEVNHEVFDSIKEYLRETEDGIQTTVPESRPEENQISTLSSLERLGGFSVEKEVPETENNRVTAADRGEILAGLENPPASVPTQAGIPPARVTPSRANPPANLPTDGRSAQMPEAVVAPQVPKIAVAKTTSGGTPENHTEPLVDYLLGNASGQSAQKVTVQAPKVAGGTSGTPTPKAMGNDPYREAIK